MKKMVLHRSDCAGSLGIMWISAADSFAHGRHRRPLHLFRHKRTVRSTGTLRMAQGHSVRQMLPGAQGGLRRAASARQESSLAPLPGADWTNW